MYLRLWCLNTAPLGLPVVPEVYLREAISPKPCQAGQPLPAGSRPDRPDVQRAQGVLPAISASVTEKACGLVGRSADANAILTLLTETVLFANAFRRLCYVLLWYDRSQRVSASTCPSSIR